MAKVDLVGSHYGIDSKRVSHGTLGLVLTAHAGLLFALATHHKAIPLPVEQPILVSLITEAPPVPDVALKPLPTRPQPVKPVVRPVKKPAMPQASAAPKKPEPQLAATAVEKASVPAPDQRQTAPAVESPPQPLQPNLEPARVAEAPPREAPIEQPKFNADYLDNPAPAYPALARKLREEGRVLLRVRVDVGGHPTQVTLHESSGFARLDERAAETVRRWKFVPARKGGEPVEAWVIVPIQFSLKG